MSLDTKWAKAIEDAEQMTLESEMPITSPLGPAALVRRRPIRLQDLCYVLMDRIHKLDKRIDDLENP